MTDPYDDDSDYDEDDSTSEEWQPGECDRCHGETVYGPLGPVYCACAIEQGAADEDCVCGPEED
ncbi:hypothetical protein ABH930_000299 [Kitasatospora sp. GAS204A]|uniref:hypothetical protein n=1 Tax=unclassified Kitasatospora TaxID=2633591 RepID=UPI002475AD7A|nr:hypothetical protein [Kitasatospora sp. GAS204B]MDH6116880.1 hypothetical protein [Kitasatospora sp. GAS204B]